MDTTTGKPNRLCEYCGGYHLYSDQMCRDMNTHGFQNDWTREIDRLRAENAVLTGDIDEWRRQWMSLSEEVAKLTAQRDKAGEAALELEQRCAELDQELSRLKQGKEAE